MAWAAAIFISSLISVALTSKAPLNIPGNAKTLFIWLGKSERPVPITFAPAFLASSGKISGVGLAIANNIESEFIEVTISFDTMLGAETPINTSAFLITSHNNPDSLFGFVILESSVK